MIYNIEVYIQINYSRGGIGLKALKNVLPMLFFSGTSGEDKPRKRNQEMGTRKQCPTQETVEGISMMMMIKGDPKDTPLQLDLGTSNLPIQEG